MADTNKVVEALRDAIACIETANFRAEQREGAIAVLTQLHEAVAALTDGVETCVCNCARAGGACVVRNGGRLPEPLRCADGVDAYAAQRHAANEWADMATNGIQCLKNVRDGISTPDAAIASLERDLVHCRTVQAAAGVETGEWGQHG